MCVIIVSFCWDFNPFFFCCCLFYLCGVVFCWVLLLLFRVLWVVFLRAFFVCLFLFGFFRFLFVFYLFCFCSFVCVCVFCFVFVFVCLFVVVVFRKEGRKCFI